ncbi:hypothetical protein PALS2_184 [Staphylococcus phage PALS_2]|nr:hypothetical protein PALS2_184 [Staphylococcus phage PALS_2]UAJ16937.1 hypothetical protein UFVDC4_00009 [Staphylococcus phage vB_SauM-UFV_DC4]BDE75579.1 hypothetical protein [Staphylococcus phage S6]
MVENDLDIFKAIEKATNNILDKNEKLKSENLELKELILDISKEYNIKDKRITEIKVDLAKNKR